MENLKRCGRCRESYELSMFHKDNSRKDGLNPTCKLCRSIESKKYSRADYNKEYFKSDNGAYTRRKYVLMHSYKLSEEEYTEMLDKTRGCCPVCLQGFTFGKTKRRIVIDHNHETGEVRGLLCSSCNVGLGQVGDTLESVERLVKYLKGE